MGWKGSLGVIQSGPLLKKGLIGAGTGVLNISNPLLPAACSSVLVKKNNRLTKNTCVTGTSHVSACVLCLFCCQHASCAVWPLLALWAVVGPPSPSPFPGCLSKKAPVSQLHLVCCVHHPLTFLPLFSEWCPFCLSRGNRESLNSGLGLFS